MKTLAQARADYAVLDLEAQEIVGKRALLAAEIISAFMREREIEEGDEIVLSYRWSLGSPAQPRLCRVDAIRCHRGSVVFNVRRVMPDGNIGMRTYQMTMDDREWTKP